MSSIRSIWLSAMVMCGVFCAALSAFGGGAFSQSGPLGNGNLDASIGLSTSKTYTNAYNCNGANVTINGIPFTGFNTITGVNGAFSMTGWAVPHNGASGDTIGAGSGLNTLLTPFFYNGSPETLTLTNLVVGQTYILTFYNKSWGDAEGRLQTLTSLGGASSVFDENVGGANNANLLRYTFTATNITEWVKFTAVVPGNTMHFYGFTTELLSLTNTWTSGSGNWSALNWSAGVPNNRNAQAVFPARSVQSVIRLDAPVKVGHLQFEGARSYTLDGTNALTVWTDVGGAGVFNAVTGTHQIAVSTVLSNDLVKLGNGVLGMSGIISGPRIVNAGAGTLVLSGSNIHSGGTVVNGGGILQTAHNAAVGNSPVTINAGGLLQLTSPLSSISLSGAGTVDLGISALTLNQIVTNTFSGAITGAGSLAKSGTGTLILSGAGSKYSGGTVINAGRIQVNIDGGLGNAVGTTSCLGLLAATNSVTINNGGTLFANANAILGQSGVQAAYSPAVIINEGGVFTGAAFISFLHNLSLNGGTLDIGTGYGSTWNGSFGLMGKVIVGGTAPSIISRSGTGAAANILVGNGVSGFATLFDVADVTSNTNPDLTIFAPIRNWQTVASGLRKIGLGTMVLSTTNGYSGGTRLDAGTLQLGSANALGANNNALTVNGGTLDLRGFDVSAGTLAGLGGTITDNGPLLAQPTTLVASQTVANAFAGVLADGPNQKLALVKSGSAMLTLSGLNTYSGTTTINAGTLALDGTAAVGALTTSGVIVNSAGTLAFTPGLATALTNKAGSTVTLNGGTLAFDITSGGAADLLVVDTLNVTASSTLALAGLGNLIPNTAYPVIKYSALSGADSLSVPNAGRLSLIVTNDTTTSQIKVLTALDNAAWANTAGGVWDTTENWTGYTPVLAGHAALLGSGLTASDTVSLPVPLLLGYLTFDHATARYTVGTIGGTNLTLSTGNAQVPSLIRVLNGSHTIAENIVLSNDVSVTTAASTSLALDGSFSGAFALAKYGEGELLVTASNTFSGGTALYAGTLATSNSFALGSGVVALNSGLLRLQQGLTVNSNLSSLAGSTIDLGSNILTVVQSGNSVMAGVITNTGALFKDGSGALTLAGANTFSGGVTLTNGTLNLGHASALGSGPLLIQGGSFDNLSGAALTVANVINLNANTTFNATDPLELAGAVSITNADRTITLGAGSGTLTVTGRLVGSNANRFLRTAGTGTFNLGGVWTNITAGTFARIIANHVGTFNVLSGSRIKMGDGTGGLLNLYGNVVGTIQNNAVLTMAKDTFKIGATISTPAGGPSILNLVPGGTFNFETSNNLLLGEGNGGVGTYSLFNMTGGTLAMGSGTGLVLGGPQDSTAAFSGGTATLYNVNTLWTANANLYTGTPAAHTFTVGGTADVTVNDTFVSSYNNAGLSAGHTAFINLLGDSNSRGVLTTVALSGADSTNWTSTLTFDGGLLRVNAAGANSGAGAGSLASFFGNIDTVKVKAGGARIDTQGKIIRISQGLAGDPASAGGGLMKLGTGLLALAGPCSYAGATIISNGTLKVGALDALPGNAAVVVAGGIYDLGGFTITNGTVTMTGGTIANGALDAIVSVTGTNASMSAVLTGQAIKSGNGVLRLTGDQSAFTRGTVAEGTLQLASTNDLIVAPPNAVACYRFEDSLTDATGNGHNGTSEGTGSSFVAGRSANAGQAINFTGSADVAVTYTADLALSAYTVSAWVNLNTAPGASMFGILGTRFGGETTFDLKVQSTKVHADIGNGAIWLNLAADFNVVVPVGSWHMITYAVDGLANEVRMYYDGVLTNTMSIGGIPLLMKTGETLKIGLSSTGEFMNGKMDDVYIYGSALSGDQVKTLHQEGTVASSGNQLSTNANLAIAAGAIVDLNGHTQTLGGLSGSGMVSNGTLTVSGTTAPGGTNVLGTLTLATTTTLSGKLLIDVKTDGACDVLQVKGSLSLVDLDLQIQDMGQLNTSKEYVIARFTPGNLTGRFRSNNLDSLKVVFYNNAAGEIRLIGRGTIISFR